MQANHQIAVRLKPLPCPRRVEQFVDSGRTGAIIDILNAVFSIASCMFYIVESYDKALLDKGYKTWLEAIQVRMLESSPCDEN